MNFKSLVALFLLTGLLILFSCSDSSSNIIDSEIQSTRIQQDSIAFQLCQLYGADQILRNSKGFNNKWDLLIWPTDSILFEKLHRIIKDHGYPRAENVGLNNMKSECVNSAAYSILLHSPHRLINEEKYLKFYLKEAKEGRMDIKVLLEVLDKPNYFKKDKNGNRELIYGSSWGKPCLKNRVKSDSARMKLGLPALEEKDFIICSEASN